MEKMIVIMIFLFVIYYSLRGQKDININYYLYNNFSTSTFHTTFSAIAGNVGAGTVMGLYAFGQRSLLLGLLISLFYSIGIFFISIIGRYIYKLTLNSKNKDLISYLIESHRVTRFSFIVWLSISIVFIMQLSVQLLSLSYLTSMFFNIPKLYSIIFSSIVIGIYVVYMGYRAATISDAPQALIIILVSFVIFYYSATNIDFSSKDIFILSKDDIVLSIAVILFVAPTVFISVDNWHRIVTANSISTISRSFVLASFICLFIYLSFVFAGYYSKYANIDLINFLGSKLSFVIYIALAFAILSTFDTTIMPLVSYFSLKINTLTGLRMIVISLLVVVTAMAYLIGDLVNAIVAVFSSLAVFIPPILFSFSSQKKLYPTPLLLTLPISVISTIILSFAYNEYAAIIGFVVSMILYTSSTIICRAKDNCG